MDTGTFLHRNTSKVLFRGTVGNDSELVDGILYDEDGTIMGRYNSSKYEPAPDEWDTSTVPPS